MAPGITHLGTDFAMVWLLARMHPLVHSEGRPLNKHLATVGKVANMRPHTTVNTFFDLC